MKYISKHNISVIKHLSFYSYEVFPLLVTTQTVFVGPLYQNFYIPNIQKYFNNKYMSSMDIRNIDFRSYKMTNSNAINYLSKVSRPRK